VISPASSTCRKIPCRRTSAFLARAGLVQSERHSRSIIYRADLDGLRALTLFLVKDCCAGNAELCAPLVAELTPCC
jgi:ArsR family transcriptional regulator